MSWLAIPELLSVAAWFVAVICAEVYLFRFRCPRCGKFFSAFAQQRSADFDAKQKAADSRPEEFVRRVVTGLNGENKSVVLFDSRLPLEAAPKPFPLRSANF